MAMTPCPVCGAEILPEARFCRRCGAQLRGGPGDPARTLPADEDPARTRPDDDPARTRPGDDSARSAGSSEDPTRVLAVSDETAGASGEGEGFTSSGRADFDGYDDELTVATPRRVEPLDGSELRRRREQQRRGPRASSIHDTPADEDERYRQPRGYVDEGFPHYDDDDDDEGFHHIHSHQSQPRRRWPVIVALCLSFLLFAAAGAWFAVRYVARRSTTASSTLPPLPPPPADTKQLFEDKLAEAEALLAQGDMDAALARLREANAIDPANTRAHRRLGEILFDAGARRASIESFRAVTRNAPQDFTAWRQLAAAQVAEGLHRDAAESYRRVIALVGEQRADPQDLLSYADALRLSDRTEEARAVYERLAATPYTLIAEAARKHLAAMPTPTPSPTPTPATDDSNTQPGEDGATEPPAPPAQPPAPRNPSSPAQPPTQNTRPAASSPSDQYRRDKESGLNKEPGPSGRAATAAPDAGSSEQRGGNRY